MKNFSYAILAHICLIALFFTGSISVKAQTADDIIQKHITSIGGTDNWKKINTMKLNCITTASGMEIPITLTRQHKKGIKVEISMGGITGYSIITDKTGWNYMPFGGQTSPEVIPDEMVKQQQDGLDLQGKLIDYKTKGYKAVFLGKDEVEGTECYKIKLSSSSGKDETMYFDMSNYYLIRSVEKFTANGKEEEAVSNYGNYTKLPEGIVVPMSLDQGMGSMTIKSVEINKPIPDDFFKPANADTKK